MLVVGAGFAGLYALHTLRGMAYTVAVLDAAADVGGVWYWNRYPGARCDVESLQYSYSFDQQLEQEWRWTERYAAQPEILRYIRHVAERFDLRRDVRFNTRVASAVFDEAQALWRLSAEDGRQFEAPFCILQGSATSKARYTTRGDGPRTASVFLASGWA